MHVLQWIAVVADDEDMAMRTVEDTLNSELGGNEYATNAWYDWFVIGGGRWNPEQDPYQSSSNMIISLEEHGMSAIQEKIDWAIEARMKEFSDYRKSLDRGNIDIIAELDKYTGNMNYSFELYPLGKCVDMLQGVWDFNSYFYDMHTASTNTKHMLDNMATGNVNWYLVPVDFHF